MSVTPYKTKKEALAAIKKLHGHHKKLRKAHEKVRKAHEKQEQDLQLNLETAQQKLRAMTFPR
jgi:hypothetical protein